MRKKRIRKIGMPTAVVFSNGSKAAGFLNGSVLKQYRLNA
jgi:hypothetical protein